MLNVLLTVDTEIWPRHREWRQRKLADDYALYIDGKTPAGDFGVPFQVRELQRHNLKGVFLVEALFASEVGIEPLARLVSMIQDAGQEVQLHLHTEWLQEMREPLLGQKFGRDIREFSEDEQAKLIETGLKNLAAAGARKVTAFRAGNYGAGFATLRALRRNGLQFDTSYNEPRLGPQCGLHTPSPLLQPKQLEGIWEFPVTAFEDYPGHLRPLQLCAASSREMEATLMQAWKQGWHSVVIVFHNFELMKRPSLTAPDMIVVERFRRFCKFMAENSDKFRSAGFNDIEMSSLAAVKPGERIRSNLFTTGRRVLEQAASRFL